LEQYRNAKLLQKWDVCFIVILNSLFSMKSKTTLLLELWMESHTRLSPLLKTVTAEDLKKKLGDSPNSVGFLMRHIADVELLFAKNVFGNTDLKVSARTVIEKRDTGEWIELQPLLTYLQYSYETLKATIENQIDTDWESNVETKEFGTKTKAEAFGRIVSHTAYHAGQMAILVKYGTI